MEPQATGRERVPVRMAIRSLACPRLSQYTTRRVSASERPRRRSSALREIT